MRRRYDFVRVTLFTRYRQGIVIVICFKALSYLGQNIKILTGITLTFCCHAISTAGMQNDNVQGELLNLPATFTAQYQLKHQPSDEVIARYLVTMGDDGVRIDQRGQGASASIILNTRIDKMWLLDRRLNIAHEVPLQVKADFNESKMTGPEGFEKFDQPDVIESLAAFIQFQPCAGLIAKQIANTNGEPDNIQLWQCSYGGDVIERQWFDASYGLVVRSDSFDGMQTTISNIQNVYVGAEYFSPSSEYQLSTFEDVLLIKQPLVEYKNKNTLSEHTKNVDDLLIK